MAINLFTGWLGVRIIHPWRTMPHHGMTPHVSGTSLSAQARNASGGWEVLECWFEGRPICNEYLIVEGGKLAGTGAFLQQRQRYQRLRRSGEIQGFIITGGNIF